jgi:hypothetical protein
MDLGQTKQKSHWENAIALVFNQGMPETHECSVHVFLVLHAVILELHGVVLELHG